MKKIIYIFFILYFLQVLNAHAALRDSYTSGNVSSGAACCFTGGRHSWDAARIQVTGTYSIRRIKLGVRRVNCEQSGTCDENADKTTPLFTLRIYTHDAVNDRPGTLIGTASSSTLNYLSVSPATTNHLETSTAFQDVWFVLNTPVTPGLYWVVIHNVDYDDSHYPNNLDHYLQFNAANISPLGGGSWVSRVLSYTETNNENSASWVEFYTGQIVYSLYDDTGTTTGTTYYVGGGTCSDSYAGTNISQPWCTIGKANATLVAGDLVYIRGGTYTASYVNPARSGTSGNYIAYEAYPGETVTLTSMSYAISISSRSFIRVKGINGTNMSRMLRITNGSHHIIIDSCVFGPHGAYSDWAANRINYGSSYITIRNCTFYNYGTTGDNGVLLEIGRENQSSTVDNTNRVLIENSHFYHAAHHVIGLNAHHCVLRNNFIHSDPWINGAYGGRGIYSQGSSGYVYRNLIENNRLGDAADPSDENKGASILVVDSYYNIVRRNKIIRSYNAGISLYCNSNYQSCPHYNRIYNNSIFNTGRGAASASEQRSCISIGGSSSIIGNHFKNNIHEDCPTDYIIYSGTSSGNQVFANNWLLATGDPLFVSEAGTNPYSMTAPDLDIQSTSPVIDNGGYLTSITSASGTGTTFTVADSWYFTDGWGIVQGDIIQLANSTQRAQITYINYATHAITVDSALMWNQNQGIALAYAGTAPDQGAHEYGLDTGVGPPVGPGGLVVTPDETETTINWNAVSGATSYNLYWSMESGLTKETGVKISNVTTPYVHSGLVPGCTYYYIVTAENDYGEGAASAEANAQLSVYVILSWDAVTTYTDFSPCTPASYKIYYGLSSESRTYSLVIPNDPVCGPRCEYILSGLEPNTLYYFQVTAIDEYGVESDYSNEASNEKIPICITPSPSAGGNWRRRRIGSF